MCKLFDMNFCVMYNLTIKLKRRGVMEVMFWVWLGVIALTAIVEFISLDLTSIWFTIGAIIPFILSSIGGVRWEIQVATFVVVSALLLIFLRKITRKFLLKNANYKTNVDALIGKKVRMIERTDFETLGAVKINDVVWSARAEKSETIEKGQIVEVVRVDGNKLIVKMINEQEDKTKEKITEQKTKEEKIEVADTSKTNKLSSSKKEEK